MTVLLSVLKSCDLTMMEAAKYKFSGSFFIKLGWMVHLGILMELTGFDTYNLAEQSISGKGGGKSLGAG